MEQLFEVSQIIPEMLNKILFKQGCNFTAWDESSAEIGIGYKLAYFLIFEYSGLKTKAELFRRAQSLSVKYGRQRNTSQEVGVGEYLMFK